MADEETYHFYGKPLETEVETRGYRKAVAPQGSVRCLPLHKQEVTDEQGRKRFHGAFTGGFSAGYYNTVGSEVRCLVCVQRDLHTLALHHPPPFEP
jgi:G patch domain-containing protein 1